MKYVKFFEDFDEKKERPEIKKRDKKAKHCIGKCVRKFFIEDNKPVIYCPSCDRILNPGI